MLLRRCLFISSFSRETIIGSKIGGLAGGRGLLCCNGGVSDGGGVFSRIGVGEGRGLFFCNGGVSGGGGVFCRTGSGEGRGLFS